MNDLNFAPSFVSNFELYNRLEKQLLQLEYLVLLYNLNFAPSPPFPTEIFVLIFRSDPSVYYLSRMVSKTIRNASFAHILQHEMKRNISFTEAYNFAQEHPCSLITKYQMHNGDDNRMMHDTYTYVEPFNIIVNRFDYKTRVLSWHQRQVYNQNQVLLKNRIIFTKLEGERYHEDFDQLLLDVDFFSYYHIILQRLSLYQCDQKLLATKFLLDKFNQAKANEINYSIFLTATAYVLGSNLAKLEHEKLVSELGPIVEKELNKLVE